MCNNPCPIAVAMILVKRDEEIGLLGMIRNVKSSIGYGGCAMPCGYIDEGEDVGDAVSREFNEEIGILTDKSDWLLYNAITNKENKLNLFSLYNKVLDFKFVENEFKVYKEKIIAKQESGEDIKLEARDVIFIDIDTEIVFPTHKIMVDAIFKKNINDIKNFDNLLNNHLMFRI